MKWKVSKAWTSVLPHNGFRHFMLISHGGKGLDRWVELEAVLNRCVRIRIGWNQLKNQNLWTSGWQQLPPQE